MKKDGLSIDNKVEKKKMHIFLIYICMIMNIVIFPQTVSSNTKDKLSQINEQKEQLTMEKKDLTEELLTLSSQLVALDSKIAKKKQLINEKKKEIERVTVQLELARKDQTDQYQQMKKRIQFYYENHSRSYLQIFMQSGSLTTFLNQLDNQRKVQEYDRKKLEQYENISQLIQKYNTDLKLEKKDLQKEKKNLEEEQEKISDLVADIQQKMADHKAAIAVAEQAALSCEAKLQEEQEKEQKLRVGTTASMTEQATAAGTPIAYDSTAGEAELLAAIIECEAGGESYEGKLAVGSVVMNRVANAQFPDTITGVIYQKGQFSPVASGRFVLVLARGADDTCRKAAAEVLNGNITLNYLFFRVNDGSILSGYILGNHIFY